MPEVQTQETQEQEVDYVQAIKELRDNTVSKDQYKKLKDENQKLLKSLINGETIEASEAAPMVDVSELRKQLYGGGTQLSDLEYITKTLDLRDELIARGEADPFLPIGHQIAPTDSDRAAAAKVAKVMRECVEDADGDNNLFLSLLARQTIDTPAPKARK